MVGTGTGTAGGKLLLLHLAFLGQAVGWWGEWEVEACFAASLLCGFQGIGEGIQLAVHSEKRGSRRSK